MFWDFMGMQDLWASGTVPRREKIMTLRLITREDSAYTHTRILVSIIVGFYKHNALPRSLILTNPNNPLTLKPKPSSNPNLKNQVLNIKEFL